MHTHCAGHGDPDDHDPCSLHFVCQCQSAQQAHDLGLTILAADLAYWVMPNPDGFALMVETPDAEYIKDLLEAPTPIRERRPDVGRPVNSSDVVPVAIFWILIASISCLALTSEPGLISRGGLVAEDVLQRGEWWRAITSLTLHADFGHLIANLVPGFFIILALAQRIGGGNAVLATLGSGILGNVLVVLVRHQHPMMSIGSSTALFGALGVLCGLPGIVRHLDRNRRNWAPLAAGVVILGVYGSGDSRTDVLAHVCGFAAGWLIGRVLTRGGQPRETAHRVHETTRTLLACALPLLAWLRALWGQGVF